MSEWVAGALDPSWIDHWTGSSSVTVTRRLTFSAGHRVFGHESKCAHPHGHNYAAYVKATAAALDGIGRVIDFGAIKSLMGGWLDGNWDHAFLYYGEDPELTGWFEAHSGWRSYACPFNPTAENMANFLLHVVAPGLFEGSGVTVVEVTVEETENCRATARL